MKKLGRPEIPKSRTRRWLRENTDLGYDEFIKLIAMYGKPSSSLRVKLKKRMSGTTAGAYVGRFKDYEAFCEARKLKALPFSLKTLKSFVAYRAAYVSVKSLQFDFSAIRSVAGFAGFPTSSSDEMQALIRSMPSAPTRRPAKDPLAGIARLLACVPGLTVATRRSFQTYINGRLTPMTADAYATIFEGFAKFCDMWQLSSLPADSTSIAPYIAFRRRSVGGRTVRRDLCAIRLVHELAGFGDPIADERIHDLVVGQTRSSKPGRLHAITVAELRQVVAPLDDQFMFERRDRCIILLCYAGGLMSRTALKIDRSLITFEDDGAMIVPTADPRRPSVRIAPGLHSVTCPVLATKNWLELVGSESGPLFPAWDARGAWTRRPISVVKLYLTVRERCRRVGIDEKRLGARSLRQGFIIAGARVIPPAKLAKFVGFSTLNALEHHTGRLSGNQVVDGPKARAILKRRWGKSAT